MISREEALLKFKDLIETNQKLMERPDQKDYVYLIERINETFSIAAHSISKQIALNPSIQSLSYIRISPILPEFMIVYYCNGCGERVNRLDSFCHSCGQAQDWSGL